jgi:hypothetical protein
MAICVALGVDTLPRYLPRSDITEPTMAVRSLDLFALLQLPSFSLQLSSSQEQFLGVGFTGKLGCPHYLFSLVQLSEMRHIPRGLPVDLGQGEFVMWMKDEVQGSNVLTRQDVRHVESILHGSASSPSNHKDCSTWMVPHRIGRPTCSLVSVTFHTL